VSSPDAIEIRRWLPAPIAEVFRWWTEAEMLSEWMTPFGEAEAFVDLRVGGGFRIVMRSGDVTIHHRGEFVEIEAPRRLVFTWVSPYTGPEPSLVTVELEPDGESATQLRMVHGGLPSDVAQSHRDGWGAMLERLRAGLSRNQAEVAKWPSTS